MSKGKRRRWRNRHRNRVRELANFWAVYHGLRGRWIGLRGRWIGGHDPGVALSFDVILDRDVAHLVRTWREP